MNLMITKIKVSKIFKVSPYTNTDNSTMRDLSLKNQIESVIIDYPDYGHRRIAKVLKINKKSVSRIMKKFEILPLMRKVRKRYRKNDGNVRENLVMNYEVTKPNQIWRTDYTYIKFQNSFVYLATVLDQFTKEIIGFTLSRNHKDELTSSALMDAIKSGRKPEIIHSDQGAEYTSKNWLNICGILEIKPSFSNIASPWQNSYQESFYSNFKLLLGKTNTIKSISELAEKIYQNIYYYNYKRLHSTINMTPNQFYQSFVGNQF